MTAKSVGRFELKLGTNSELLQSVNLNTMNLSQLFVFAGLLAGATSIQAAPVASPIATLPAERNGLKISIAPTSTNHDSDLSIALHRGDPHLNVVLQNTSKEPIHIFQEWNSWGYQNLTLQITAVDGKTLDKPLEIKGGPRMWVANTASTDVIEVGQTMVREVRFALPPDVVTPQITAPSTESGLSFESPEIRVIPRPSFPKLDYSGRYFGFPFSQSDSSRSLTIRAVFSNADNLGEWKGTKAKSLVWTGQIASPLKNYRFFWDAD